MRLPPLILSILLLVLTISYSQDESLQKSKPSPLSANASLGLPPEIITKTDHFFKKLILSDVDGAFNEFLQDSPISGKKDQLRSLIDQAKRSVELYGKMDGYEIVSHESVTESFLKVRFLALHSKFPMRWIISFYRSPDKGWIIINIKFDDLAEYYFTDE